MYHTATMLRRANCSRELKIIRPTALLDSLLRLHPHLDEQPNEHRKSRTFTHQSPYDDVDKGAQRVKNCNTGGNLGSMNIHKWCSGEIELDEAKQVSREFIKLLTNASSSSIFIWNQERNTKSTGRAMRTVNVMSIMCVHNKALFLFNCNVWDFGRSICRYPRQQAPQTEGTPASDSVELSYL